MSRIKAPYRNYERNQRTILEAYKKLQTNENPLPSYREIAKETNFSLSTIHKHFKTLDFDYICQQIRIYTPEVTKALAEKAISGTSRDKKLYYQIVEKYIEQKHERHDVLGKLDVNANISGEFKLTINKRIITSRADLQAIEDEARSAADKAIDKDAESKDKKAVSLIDGIDTAVFFTK